MKIDTIGRNRREMIINLMDPRHLRARDLLVLQGEINKKVFAKLRNALSWDRHDMPYIVLKDKDYDKATVIHVELTALTTIERMAMLTEHVENKFEGNNKKNK